VRFVDDPEGLCVKLSSNMSETMQERERETLLRQKSYTAISLSNGAAADDLE